ncbi:MAG: hypothetical protein GXO26_08460 [Crenarchaeota archaeon]|nr:hypothetical protein [Thermoproteota archaeon]
MSLRARELESLYSSTITRVEARTSESRSGLTLYVSGFRAVAESNKHIHDLSCIFVNNMGRIETVCDWKMDGQDMGMLVLSEHDPFVEKVLNIIDTAWRLKNIDGTEIPEPPNTIELRKASIAIRPMFRIPEKREESENLETGLQETAPGF